MYLLIGAKTSGLDDILGLSKGLPTIGTNAIGKQTIEKINLLYIVNK